MILKAAPRTAAPPLPPHRRSAPPSRRRWHVQQHLPHRHLWIYVTHVYHENATQVARSDSRRGILHRSCRQSGHCSNALPIGAMHTRDSRMSGAARQSAASSQPAWRVSIAAVAGTGAVEFLTRPGTVHIRDSRRSRFRARLLEARTARRRKFDHAVGCRIWARPASTHAPQNPFIASLRASADLPVRLMAHIRESRMSLIRSRRRVVK